MEGIIKSNILKTNSILSYVDKTRNVTKENAISQNITFIPIKKEIQTIKYQSLLQEQVFRECFNEK